jgi:hypothetical protein
MAWRLGLTLGNVRGVPWSERRPRVRWELYSIRKVQATSDVLQHLWKCFMRVSLRGARVMTTTTVWQTIVIRDLLLDVNDGPGVAEKEDATEQGVKRKRAPHTKGPCPHGVKYRSACKVCSACPHGRKRAKCKECGGASICEHGRVRSECKECGGASICEHGRERRRCKECGGSQICEHGRVRSRCKECGGSSICEHGRQRHTCKECGGSQICEHGRRRYRCKECRASKAGTNA